MHRDCLQCKPGWSPWKCLIHQSLEFQSGPFFFRAIPRGWVATWSSLSGIPALVNLVPAMEISGRFHAGSHLGTSGSPGRLREGCQICKPGRLASSLSCSFHQTSPDHLTSVSRLARLGHRSARCRMPFETTYIEGIAILVNTQHTKACKLPVCNWALNT